MSVVTWIVNGLYRPSKRQILAEWTLKNTIQLNTVYKRFTLDPKTQIDLKVKVWKMLFHANRNQRRAGAAIPTPGKMNFKSKRVIRDKERHYILIKSLRQQKTTYYSFKYIHNNRPSKFLNLKNIKSWSCIGEMVAWLLVCFHSARVAKL